MLSKNRFGLLIGSFVIFIVITFFILLSTFFLISFFSTGDNHHDEIERSEATTIPLYSYQYYRLNPQTKESSFGSVKIPRKLKTEFEMYREEDDTLVLLSEFGKEEYQCTGSCSCLKTERKTSSTTTMSRGMVYLLTAASSLIAIRLSKQYFSSECVNNLKDTCPYDQIFSEVENCENIYSTKMEGEIDEVIKKKKSTWPKKLTEEENAEVKRRLDEIFSEDEEEESNLGEMEKDEDPHNINHREYHCTGNCLRKKYRTKEAREMSTNFDCESLTQNGEVVVDPEQPGLRVKSDSGITDVLMQAARLKFQNEYMNDYCIRISIAKDTVDFMRKGRGPYFMERKISLCVGRNKVGINPSIKCRLTKIWEYEPTDSNDEEVLTWD